MRQLLTVALVFSLSGFASLAQAAPASESAPALNASTVVSPHPLEDSAHAAMAGVAMQQASGDYMPGGMKPGYFWTSIGMVSAGGLYLLTGAALGAECSSYDVDCGGMGTRVALFGGALIGGGVYIWMLGKKKAANPSLTFAPILKPHGVALRSTYHF